MMCCKQNCQNLCPGADAIQALGMLWLNVRSSVIAASTRLSPFISPSKGCSTSKSRSAYRPAQQLRCSDGQPAKERCVHFLEDSPTTDMCMPTTTCWDLLLLAIGSIDGSMPESAHLCPLLARMDTRVIEQEMFFLWLSGHVQDKGTKRASTDLQTGAST